MCQTGDNAESVMDTKMTVRQPCACGPYRRCSRCGERNPAAFYASKRWLCKDCHANAMRLNRRDNPKLHAYESQRGKLPHRQLLSKRWKQDHPVAYRAITALGWAVRSNKLKRGLCDRCGSSHKVYGIHADYSKPLDVVWRCCSCHLRKAVTVSDRSPSQGRQETEAFGDGLPSDNL